MKFLSTLIASTIFLAGSVSLSAPLCADVHRTLTGDLEAEGPALRAVNALINQGALNLKFLGEYSTGQRPTQKLKKFKGQFRNKQGMIYNMIAEIISEKVGPSLWQDGEPVLTLYPILFERGQQITLKKDPAYDSDNLGRSTTGRTFYTTQIKRVEGNPVSVVLSQAPKADSEGDLSLRFIVWD